MLAAYVAALMMLPPLIAWALRRTGAPGAAVLGGIIAGVLLGPTIFGRLAPRTFEQIVVGGVEQREARDTLDHRLGALLVASEAAVVDPQAQAETVKELGAARAEATQQWHAAKEGHQRPLRTFALIVAALMLLAAAGEPRHEPLAGDRPKPSTLAPLTIGAWSAAVPGSLAYLAARWWGDSSAAAALTAVAVAIGPWLLSAIDRQAADDAELEGAQLVRTAGRFASIIAIVVAVVALGLARGWDGLTAAIPLAALPLAWLIAARPKTAVKREAASGGPSLLLPVATNWLLPVLAACAASRIELFAHFILWPIIILPLLSGDGRWLGAVIGALLAGGRGGTRTFRTMRLMLGSMAAGPTQLAIVVVGLAAGVMSESAAYGLIIGALIIELTVPARRIMAARLVETEQQLERLSDE